MIWGPQTVGGGDSFGILYFRNSIGLAPKAVSDGGVGGSGFDDTRAGTSSLQYEHNGGKMPGFGWVHMYVDTHFNARGRLGRLPPILSDIGLSLGVGIDERTAFFLEYDKATVWGYNAVTICDMSQAVVKPQSFFTASGIRGHYLTHGDSYAFAQKAVRSSKSPITAPAYSGPTDSSDILAAYEASLLATREIDQKAVYNLGRTRRPKDFS
jgi:cyanophycinase